MNAGFLLRFKAFLVDYLLIFAYLLFLLIINLFVFPSLQEFFQKGPVAGELAGFLMVTLPVSAYFIIGEAFFNGQTYGKKKLGIKTVSSDGEKLSFGKAVFRTVVKFLPWELSHFLVHHLVALGDVPVPIYYYLLGGFIYFLMFLYILTAVFTKRKQSIYDIAAKTLVVKIR